MMITGSTITLWHGGEARIFEAHVYEKRGSDAEHGGKVYDNEMIVRIPTEEKIAVERGDWIALGVHYEMPPKDMRRKVVLVVANLYGLNPHYRVVAV